jgi:hypothetical protein
VIGSGKGDAAQPTQCTLLLRLDTTEAVSEGDGQVAQRLLWGARGDRIHPRHIGLLERVEFPVQIHRRWAGACSAMFILLARQAPVICPARRSRALAAGGNLRGVQI